MSFSPSQPAWKPILKNTLMQVLEKMFQSFCPIPCLTGVQEQEQARGLVIPNKIKAKRKKRNLPSKQMQKKSNQKNKSKKDNNQSSVFVQLHTSGGGGSSGTLLSVNLGPIKSCSLLCAVPAEDVVLLLLSIAIVFGVVIVVAAAGVITGLLKPTAGVCNVGALPKAVWPKALCGWAEKAVLPNEGCCGAENDAGAEKEGADKVGAPNDGLPKPPVLFG
mmetsp:Transcript_1236/g.1674  ORF Transcript_1236/g.1674 Transcript_1236/m.1674 type:complete len:219 (-) Transcript_1236:555-1211(-)